MYKEDPVIQSSNPISEEEYDRMQASEDELNQYARDRDQRLANEKAEYERTTNEDGSLKSSHELKDPSEFGVTENIQDLGNALVGGVQDAWNNTVDLGKYFDPEFYKQRTEGQDPYEFASNFKFNDQPITRTKWGKVIRGITDIGIGFVGLGKIGAGIKGIRGLTAASQVSKTAQIAPKALRGTQLAKTLGKGALKGGIVDAWDSDSTDANIAQMLVDTDITFFDALEPIATNDYMSPAQRVGYNVLEGMALGGLLDIALEGAGAAFRSGSRTTADQAKATKKAADKARAKEGLDPIDKAYPTPLQAVNLNLDLEYKGRGELVTESAQKKYEKEYFTTLKKNNIVGKDVSIDEWRQTWQTPTREQIVQQLDALGYSTESADEILEKIQPKWEELDDQVKAAYIEKQASDMDVDFGPERDYSRRAIKQGKQVEEVGLDQFKRDVEIGAPRENPYYTYGAEAHENAPLSVDGDVMGAVRDQVTIRNDLVSKRGANRGVMTEAAIRRVADGTDMSTDQINAIAEGLVENESFKHLYGSTSRQQMRDDFIDTTADIAKFLDITGNSHVSELTPDNMLEFLHSLHPKFKEGQVMDSINGVDVLSHRQLVATDVVLGQLSQQIRDLSKAGLSIGSEVSTTAPGNIIDGITERYKALARIRARTSAMASYNLRRFRSPESAPVKNMEAIYKEAEDKAANTIDTLREVIQKDNDSGQLFEAWQYFNSASNGDLGTMKDMEAFFQRKLNGYTEGTVQERNAIVGELMTMGINSMLSGPKTPVRATVGTALNAFMRPVSAIVGAGLTGDTRTMRESFAFLGGMWEARSDAMRKAVADFKTYLSKDDPYRGAIISKKDAEWDAMSNYYAANGTTGEKAMYSIANTMRNLNRNPFLNYGPRVMAASDAFFGQLIGRGFERARQHTKMYKTMEELQGSVDDADLLQLGFDTEAALEKNIWAADGKLTDAMAQFTWDEAAMKGDLTGGMKKLDQALDSFPAIKPFVGLFMKTGINALELTSKYTPGLNLFLQEQRDLLTKNWDDPALHKYGIRSPEDLANHKAVMVGRQAIGTAVVGTASMLYLNGDLTGNGPPDRALRTSWMQAGWKPRSIRVGDKYVSYDSLEPFNSFLAFVADVGDASNAMGEEWTNNEYSKLMHVLSANVVNKTFLAGLMNLQDLMTSKGQRSGSVAANLINNQVPLSSLRNELGRLFSPGMRELEDGLAAGLYNRNLWVDVLPTAGKPAYRYDILNGTILNDWDPMTRLMNAVLPFQMNLAANQTRQMLFRSQINLQQQFNTGPNGEDLDGYPDLKSRYQYLMSQQNIEASLENLFRNPQIVQSIYQMEKDRDAGVKFNPRNTLHGVQIRRIFDAAKKTAFQQLINEDSRAAGLAEQQRLERAMDQQRRFGNQGAVDNLQSVLSIYK